MVSNDNTTSTSQNTMSCCTRTCLDITTSSVPSVIDSCVGSTAESAVVVQQQQQQQQQRPEMYLVITNISKRQNIRTLLEEAIAFGCAGIYVIGQKNFDFQLLSTSTTTLKDTTTKTTTTEQRLSSSSSSIEDIITINRDIPRAIHGIIADGIVPIRQFQKWKEFMEHIEQNEIRLVGVEIHEKSKLINEYITELIDDPTTTRISTKIAFLMGNEGTGLNDKHMLSCTEFVRIAQYGHGTASLNVAVAASIILYKFHQYQREWDNDNKK